MKKIRLLAALLPLLAGIGAFPAYAQSAHHVHLTLVPAHSSIAAGETLPVAVEETIDPGWHTYWVNPGDAGQAPDLEWTLPPGFASGRVTYPPPQRMLEGPLATFGYQGSATLVQTITAPKTLPAGPLTLTLHSAILVCKDICIPDQADTTLSLNDGQPVDNHAAIGDAQKAIVDETAGRPATFGEDKGDLVLTLTPAPVSYHAGDVVTLLPADWGVIDNAQDARASLDGDGLAIRQKRAGRALAEVPHFHVLVAVQDAAGTTTLAYDATPAVTASATTAPTGYNRREDNRNSHGGLWQAIFFALLGGLVLNLMPCVFPVLSLKALKLCTLSGRDLRAARIGSLFYTLGILGSFGGLAALLIGLRAGGASIGWGFQLQDPFFVLPVAWLLLLVGLNLSGYFEIRGRFAGVGQALTAGNGAASSFFTGVLAALVATPCTAPFMGVAIGYALTQGAVVALVVFLALGFGLALPFLVIAFVPALQRALPRPGLWMVTFRQLLAFPMFLSAAWLTWIYSLQAGANAVMVALAGAIFLVFALWLQARRIAPVRWLALPVALAAFALIPLAGTMQKQARTMDGDWTPFTAAGFKTLEAGNDPIFVDMSAAWCITCKVNENAVLDTPSIAMLFHKAHVETLRGDWTNRDPAISEFLKAQGRDGVPLYVYYPPRPTKGHANDQRPPPVVLPQLLTHGIVEDAIEGRTVP